MVKKYEFGSHIPTDAVVLPVEEGGSLPWFRAARTGGEQVFTAALEPEDVVYGLGQSIGGINKRGKTYIHYNVDNTTHRENTLSLYGSHNFLVVDGAVTRGFFFDCPGRVIFDVGDTDPDALTVSCQGGVTVYALEGPGANAVVREFLALVGRSYIPPRWAFGFGQSRWGYKSAADIRAVVEGYRKAGLPLDWVCMDIDYMEDFKDFTVNADRFPDFPKFVAEMRALGVRLVPIVDAGVKIQPGDPTYEEGIAGDHFCKRPDGTPFEAAVWPGLTHFPDFLRPETRAWFGAKYRFYTDQGVEGFWNDMNEPAIFYAPETRNTRTPNALPGEDDRYQKGVRICDYKSFTHSVGGETVLHHDVHNIFGYNMTRSAAEGLDALLDRRYLLFSRSSYIGAHRYGGIWTGDNTTSWSNLRILVRQLPSLHMCGFLYTGSDIGGFIGNVGRELMLRWLAVGVFSPLMRNHVAKFFLPRECYRFLGQKAFRSILALRYHLLPYLYSEFVKAALSHDAMIKPLGFLFPEDRDARRVEDQLMVGESVMIAPILERGQRSRRVYLPQEMTQVTYGHGSFTQAPLPKGVHTVRAGLDQVVFFIPKGKALPIAPACGCTDRLDTSALTLLGDGEQYALYEDDGLTRRIDPDSIRILTR